MAINPFAFRLSEDIPLLTKEGLGEVSEFQQSTSPSPSLVRRGGVSANLL